MSFRVIIFVSSLVFVNLQKDHLVGILELNKNIFYKTNEDTHKLINRLFNLLKIRTDFTQSSKIHLLLTMHSDLNTIAENFFKNYEELRHITKANKNNKTIKYNHVIKEILDEIMKENIHSINKSTKNYTVQINVNRNATVQSDSVDSLEIIKDFLEKINKLTVHDLVKQPLNMIDTSIFPSRRKFESRDLKVWNPPSSAEKRELFNETSFRRIYNGKKTRIKYYPFMVSVHVMNEFMCAGSIISKDLVITAASCLQLAYNNRLFRENPRLILIRVGSDYTKRFGEVKPVLEIYFHPMYDSATLRHNLAIIRMAKQLQFSKKRKIRRIQYDRSDKKLTNNVADVSILGWGATDDIFGVRNYQQLLVADIDVFNFEQCQNIYSKHYVSEKHFCGGFVSKGGGACNRDVGGPGIIDGVLTGVISFGPPVCGASNAPTVFTKLGFYSQWIDDIVNMKPRIKSIRSATTTMKSMTAKKYKPLTKASIQLLRYQPEIQIEEYPEEIQILSQLINDIVLTNKSIIDEILYGDLNNDFNEIFQTTKKDSLLQHPLVNKSIFMLPAVHTFGNDNKQTIPIFGETLSNRRPVLTTPSREGKSPYHRQSPKQKIITHPPVTFDLSTKFFTDKYVRNKKTNNEIDDILSDFSKSFENVVSEDTENEDISDNYEQSANDSDYEGISIDINETQPSELVTECIKPTTASKSIKHIKVKYTTLEIPHIESIEDILVVLNPQIRKTKKVLSKPAKNQSRIPHDLHKTSRNIMKNSGKKDVKGSKHTNDVYKVWQPLGRTIPIADDESEHHEDYYEKPREKKGFLNFNGLI